METQYFSKVSKNFRDNYVETLKKLISIEEEIEKTIFYLQSLEQKERIEMFNVYKTYLEGLTSLRDDLTHLMKDNLMTTQALLKKVNQENHQTSINILTDMYKNFMDFMSLYYNPFCWLDPEKCKKKENQ
ncbi:MAG TPA: hypothetical protein DHW82_07805 [Spirochaetia bacterium]|nr:MAG: hypothetical protein A2Y41_02765 [Spirochaetes bacterium GWB1_36_13]HCL56896.1 hypothetical protein [Spirochaetia bacterium]